MAKKGEWTGIFDNLPKIAKVLLQLFFGYVISGVYRIVRYVETKNIATLVVGILALVTGIGNGIAWIVDFITLIANDKISVLAD